MGDAPPRRSFDAPRRSIDGGTLFFAKNPEKSPFFPTKAHFRGNTTLFRGKRWFFAKYKKAFLFAPLLVILDVICEIVQPYLMSGIVDVGVKQQNIALILQTGGLMIGLSLIAITANVGNIYYSSSTSVGFAAELRKGLFSKIQQFSFSNLDQMDTNS